MKIENDTSDCAVLFLRSFRVQNWCKFGAKTYRTMQKLCNDMRRKRHKIAQNERFSTIFRGINASRKTQRDNKRGTHVSICVASAVFRRVPLFVIPPRTRGRQSIALSFELKTPHWGVFLTLSQFSKR